MKFCAKCKAIVLLISFLFLLSATYAQAVAGGLKKWHKITFSINGPFASETDSFNPFLNYRLNVTFTHSSGKTYKVPGYFAADGNAAETGASAGNKWRFHFAPDETGIWTFTTSFRKGINIAVSDKDSEGVSVKGCDSLTGTFIVAPTDKTGRDLRGKGRLNYVDSSLLQFAETKEYFRKAGADAPENFLAYADFDNTPDSGGRRKTWAPHIQDWQEGDPTWQLTKGKGIIGAINYLSSQGMNSFSFLTMNIKGDDKNVYPYISPLSLTRIDVSKVSQWEMVFEHADKMGMHLHFKTQEIENENLLDSGNTGIQRKLYYRELIARFSHHLALNWNLGEENTQTTQQQKDMAQYLYSHDPYKHNIVMHTLPGKQEAEYRPLIGSASALTGVSIQTDTANVYAETKKWVLASAAANKKWIVANDEQGSSVVGVAADSEYKGNRGVIADNSDAIRKAVLWGNFMAGGAGVEYYFGYKTGETDLTCQDFRSRAKSWRYANYALDFFRTYLPQTILSPMTNISSGWIAGKDSSVYVIYLKSGHSADITLPANANNNYSVSWYNPRQGGPLQAGTVKVISGGGIRSIGNPPVDSTLDWVVLVKQTIPSVVLTTVYQAEDYTAQNGIIISSENSGYTDTGYADYAGIGSYIEWNNVKKCNTLKFYYANGSPGNRQCAIIVNGIFAGNILFEKTSGWDIWQTATINVLLKDSLNTVRVIANTISGGPNIDKMEIIDSVISPSYRHVISNPVLNIYPNPAHKNLNIVSANGGLINIYNMQGVKVYSNGRAKKTETINTGNLSPGIYMVELISNGKKITKQFIKN